MADYTDVSTLNTLIKTTIDSIKGFEDSAEDSQSGRFGSIFREFAADRRRVVTNLQQEVRRLGEEPEDDGSMAGAAHRAFIDLKSAVANRDEKAIIGRSNAARTTSRGNTRRPWPRNRSPGRFDR